MQPRVNRSRGDITIKEQSLTNLKLEIILVLLSTAANQLKLYWTRLYNITRKVGTIDYEVEMSVRRQERKIYHVNLMKKWHVMTSKPQTVLLAADLETKEEALESSTGA